LESEWWEGPTWLKLLPEKWPAEKEEIDQELIEELRKTPKKRKINKEMSYLGGEISMSNFTENNKEKNVLWHLQRFSSYHKILHITAWMLRFLNNCRKTHVNKNEEITAKEIVTAESLLCRLV